MQIKEDIQEYFKDLQFEAGVHRYNVGDRILTSVSSIIKKWEEEKDWNAIAVRYAEKHNMALQDVLDMWEEKRVTAADAGTVVHDFGENYFLDRNLKPSSGKEEALVAFWDSLPPYYEPLFSELRMYSKKHWYSGTTDNVFLDLRDNSLVLSDYKTNSEDLFKNFKHETLLAPFDFLLNNSYNKYQLQLSLYQILIEEAGYWVSDRILVWLKEDGSFKTFHTENYTTELKEELKTIKI